MLRMFLKISGEKWQETWKDCLYSLKSFHCPYLVWRSFYHEPFTLNLIFIMGNGSRQKL